MAAWKINTVRLPLNQDCWLGEDDMPAGGLTTSGYRQSVIEFVEALNAVGIVAIVDLHWSEPGRRRLRWPSTVMPDDRSATFWNSVAASFKTHPSVMFDLFNEPHSRWNPASSKVGIRAHLGMLEVRRVPGAGRERQDPASPVGRLDLHHHGHEGPDRSGAGNRRDAADHAFRRMRLRQRPRGAGWTTAPTTTS